MKGILKHFTVQLAATAVCLVVLGVGFFVLRPHLGARRASAQPPKAAETEHEVVELDEFVVNLADTDRSRYIKVTLALEVTDHKTAEHIQKKGLARVRDAIIMTLSKQYFRTVGTGEGKETLKRQLAQALNRDLPEDGGKVADILFTSLVMQ